MKELVRLWMRRFKDKDKKEKFTCYLLYRDKHGKRRQKSLGHTDARKAKRQKAQLERELRMDFIEPGSMKLSEFLEDSLARTRGQVKESTLQEYGTAMKHFIRVVGEIDYHQVKHEHGERFIQACLDGGNSPSTARKKVGNLKRLFNLAVDRGQLETNPLSRVRRPKVSRGAIRIFDDDQCIRLMKSVKDYKFANNVRWDLLILMGLCTGMRRGELLNTTWQDIDFEKQVVNVAPKQNSDYTWEWHIKDIDRRKLPLTNELIKMLAKHQAEQPEGHPYVFIPPARYDFIQKVRAKGKWSVRQGTCPLNNFNRQFRSILKRVGIEQYEFHDFRRTCITNWFAEGLSEFDVMVMAGHSSFDTTHKFYLAVRTELLDQTRVASSNVLQRISVANRLQTTAGDENEKGCHP